MKKFFVTAYKKDFKIDADFIKCVDIHDISAIYEDISFIVDVPDEIPLEEFFNRLFFSLNVQIGSIRFTYRELSDFYEEKKAESFVNTLKDSYSRAIMDLRDEYIKTLRKATKLMDIEFFEPWKFSRDMQKELAKLECKVLKLKEHKARLEKLRALMIDF